MGTQQSRSGGGQQGTRNPSERIDQRPEQDRDLQRNKQSDRGQHEQQGPQSSTSGSRSQRQQQGGSDSQQRSGSAGNRQDELADRQQRGQNVHGEGNYAASRQYDDAVKDFAESGRVEPAARAAAPKSDAEAREMEAAEEEGKRHAKGEDPALTRGPSRSTPESPDKPRPGHEEE